MNSEGLETLSTAGLETGATTGLEPGATAPRSRGFLVGFVADYPTCDFASALARLL